MWNFPTVVRLAYLIRFRSISQGILSQELPVRAMDGQLLFADSMGSWTLSYNCSYTVCGREMPVVYEVDSNLTLCATPRLEICDPKAYLTKEFWEENLIFALLWLIIGWCVGSLIRWVIALLLIVNRMEYSIILITRSIVLLYGLAVSYRSKGASWELIKINDMI